MSIQEDMDILWHSYSERGKLKLAVLFWNNNILDFPHCPSSRTVKDVVITKENSEHCLFSFGITMS